MDCFPKGTSNRQLITLILVILLLLVPGGWRPADAREATARAHSGVLDLSAWNIADGRTVNLDGEWEFYWQQLLSPEQLPTASSGQRHYFEVPKVWNGVRVAGSQLGGDGYATFHVKVLLPPQVPPLAIRILDQTSAYKLWVNGVVVAENGKVGTTRDNTIPQYRLQLARVPAGFANLDIVLQVANFSHARGGIWNPLTLGAESELTQVQNVKWGIDYILFGSLMVMGAYHVCLFVLRRNDVSSLYFGLFCLNVAVRTALTENRFLTHLLPEFPWELVFKLELLTVHIAFLLLLLFIQSLYPQEIVPWLQRILKMICYAFAGITLLAWANTSSLLVEPFHPVIIVIQLYVCVVLLKAVKVRMDGAVTILTGLLIFFFAVLNDILHNHGMISTAYIAPLGFLFLVGSQSLALARRYSKAFWSVEQFSDEKEAHNKVLSRMNEQINGLVIKLQQEVEERTAASKALETEMAERIKLEREIVKISDNERLQISYELHDGLCQQLTGARLYCTTLENRSVDDTSDTLGRDLRQLGQQLEEALNHAYELSRGLWPMDLDSRDMASSLESLVRRFAHVDGPGVEFCQELACVECTVDLSQLCRIAQESITNAIKHSNATLITVSLGCNDHGKLRLSVSDNGSSRREIASGKGGMGIEIMKHRARTLGGSLEIMTRDGGGTVVECTVPCGEYRAKGELHAG